MELKWLEDFLSLARTRSFSRSAEERYVTQSAFSRRIKALELWVGVQLVDRSSYPTTLTTAGATFRDSAEEALSLLYEVRDELRGRHRTSRDAISFYALHALSVVFFPKWLSVCEKGLGKLDTRLMSDNLHNCVRALVAGSCDFLLCYSHPSIPVFLDPNRYPSLVLGSECFIPASAVHPDKSPRYRLPGALKRPLPYLAYAPNTLLGQAVEFILAQQTQPFHLRCCFENPMADALKAMAIEGHGVAWIPESLIAEELQREELIHAGDASWEIRLEVRIYRSMENSRPAIGSLWSLLQ